MIYYPLQLLQRAGLESVLVVTGQGPRGADDRPARRRPARRARHGGAAPRRSISRTRCRRGRAGSPRSSAWRATSPRGEKLVVVLGDNIFERSQAAAIARVGRAATTGALIFVKEVPDPENFGVVVYDEAGARDRHRREGGRRRHALRRAAVERRRRRPLLLPAGRVRRDRRGSSRRAAASSRSRTSTVTTRSEGGLDVVPRRGLVGGRRQALAAPRGDRPPRSRRRARTTR